MSKDHQLIVFAGCDIELIGTFALGSLADNLHTDEESFKDDFPESTPTKYKISLMIEEVISTDESSTGLGDNKDT